MNRRIRLILPIPEAGSDNGEPGSIQPYSVSAESGAIPSSTINWGERLTARSAVATWSMKTESSLT